MKATDKEAIKKARERRHVESFLAGVFEYKSLEDSEKPDFWVKRQDEPTIALEHTEYHPLADEVQRIRRAEIESRWWGSLLPKLHDASREHRALRNIRAYVTFIDSRLPEQREHDGFVKELIQLVIDQSNEIPSGKDLEIVFTQEDSAPVFRGCEECKVLPAKSWPNSSAHLSSLTIRWSGVGV